MNEQRKNRGFTLIELVVVIAILAILAAFALPRFAQLSEQAHDSSVKGTAGGLSAGVALAKAQWIGNGGNLSDEGRTDIDGFGDEDVEVSRKGWPIATGGYLGPDNVDVAVQMNTDRCQQVWGAVMQANAPSVGSDTTTNDYTVTSADGDELCTYEYNPDGEGKYIEYNADTGGVTAELNP